MATPIISRMAHDNLVCKNVENAINNLIDIMKQNGGTCWMQSRENKEHTYELTDHVSLCFFTPVKLLKEEESE